MPAAGRDGAERDWMVLAAEWSDKTWRGAHQPWGVRHPARVLAQGHAYPVLLRRWPSLPAGQGVAA